MYVYISIYVHIYVSKNICTKYSWDASPLKITAKNLLLIILCNSILMKVGEYVYTYIDICIYRG